MFDFGGRKINAKENLLRAFKTVEAQSQQLEVMSDGKSGEEAGKSNNGGQKNEMLTADESESGRQKQLLREAAEGGEKAWNRSRIMIVGEGRAGKTALCNSITGKPFHQTASTIGIEQMSMDVRLAQVGKGGKGSWSDHLKPEKELEAALAELVLENMQERKGHPLNTQTSSPIAREQADVASHSGKESVPFDSFDQQRKRIEKPVATKVDSFDDALVMKCLAQTSFGTATEGSEAQRGKTVISIFDFGGQSVFNVLHHFFLTDYGVYLVIFNMEHMIVDGKPSPQQEGCLEYLKMWVNSIVVHSQHNKIGNGVTETAPIAFVGTRKDVVSSEDDHAAISLLLYEKFKLSLAWPSVLSDEDGQSATGRTTLHFFPVDNTLGRADPVIQRLMRCVEASIESSEYVHEKKPLSWLQTIDKLTAEPGSFITLNRVMELSSVCGVPEGDVPVMLRFLQGMGIVMWHEEEQLRDIVIMDPIDFFVKPVTLVICKHSPTKDDPTHHFLAVHKKCQKQNVREWDRFVTEGLLQPKMLHALLEEFSSSRKTLIALMEKFGLIVPCQLAEESAYFVPAVLPSANTAVGDSLLNREHCTCFLYFTTSLIQLKKQKMMQWDELSSDGFLPSGFFERLVSKVISWSQLTNAGRGVELRNIFRDEAELILSRQAFRMQVCSNINSIRLDIEGTYPRAIQRVLTELVTQSLEECMPSLQWALLLPYSTDAAAGSGLNSECFHDKSTLLLWLEEVKKVATSDSRLSMPRNLLSQEQALARYERWLPDTSARDRYDVFISYRWGPFDKPFARALFDNFVMHPLGSTRRAVVVFLDDQRLEAGRRFTTDFAKALVSSSVAVPLVSRDALMRMLDEEELKKRPDNVLVEWTIILVLAKAERLAVYPMLFGSRNPETGEIRDLFQEREKEDGPTLLEQLPNIVASLTIAQVISTLQGVDPALLASSREWIEKATVKDIVGELLQFLGFKAWDSVPGDSVAADAMMSSLRTAAIVQNATVGVVQVLEREIAHSESGKENSPFTSAALSSSSAGTDEVSVVVISPEFAPSRGIKRTLESLATNEVVQLLVQARLKDAAEVVREREFDGSMLDVIETLDELLSDDFGLKNKLEGKRLLKNIIKWKAEGVYIC